MHLVEANTNNNACKYDSKMLDKLKQTIEFFEWCSDQNVNWDKLTLCGINIDENVLASTAASLIIFHCCTLVLLLGGYPKQSSFLETVD